MGSCLVKPKPKIILALRDRNTIRPAAKLHKVTKFRIADLKSAQGLGFNALDTLEDEEEGVCL